MTDDQLLDLLQSEQTAERGFRLLVFQYQERLYWQIRKMVDQHEDANDVLQNCFIKFYRSIGSFQRKSKLYTWLYRIAVNESITYLNKQKRRAVDSLDQEDLHLVNTLEADSYLDPDLVQKRLKAALETLPEKQREVFQLRYFEEKGYKEMATMLGTSVGGLKASYHHAVKKVEGYLKAIEI
ncbi:MAG: RNA polymerase sigma factor [Saprospiraceae bacterium]